MNDFWEGFWDGWSNLLNVFSDEEIPIVSPVEDNDDEHEYE